MKTVFDFKQKYDSKYSTQAEFGWNHIQKFKPLKIDGSYQGFYSQFLSEIFDLLNTNINWTLESCYRHWRALSRLRKFDERGYWISRGMLVSVLGEGELERRYRVLETGHGYFQSWILGFLKDHIPTTTTSSRLDPDQAYLHGYVKDTYPNLYKKAYGNLQIKLSVDPPTNFNHGLPKRLFPDFEESIKMDRESEKTQIKIKEVQDALENLTNPALDVETQLFPAWLLIKKLQHDPNTPTSIQKQIIGIKESLKFKGNYITNRINDWIESYLIESAQHTFGIRSMDQIDHYHYVSPTSAIKFVETFTLINELNPNLVKRIYASIVKMIGDDECRRKVLAMKRSVIRGRSMKEWQAYQEEVMVKLIHSDKSSEDSLELIRLGSLLGLHEGFPTFASIPTHSSLDLKVIFHQISQAKSKSIFENLDSSLLIENANRLKSVLEQPGQALRRWKGSEVQEWIYFDLDFEILNEFTEYLNINQVSLTLLQNRERLVKQIPRIRERLGEVSNPQLLQWKGSNEERWMRETLSKMNGFRSKDEYEDRFRLLRQTVLPSEKPVRWDYVRAVIPDLKEKPSNQRPNRVDTRKSFGRLASWKSFKIFKSQATSSSA